MLSPDIQQKFCEHIQLTRQAGDNHFSLMQNAFQDICAGILQKKSEITELSKKPFTACRLYRKN